jgi:hypothetical protein
MGAKCSAGSWMFSTSTSAQRLGWSGPTVARAWSQMALAVASEWLPSPTANSIGGVPAARRGAVRTPPGSRQRRQRLHGARAGLGTDREAGNVSAAEHQLGCRTAGQVLARGGQRFDHRARGVVDQHQDVRQLQFGVAPHRDARRQPRDDGAFGGADQAAGRGAEVVVLEVELQHQAAPRAAVDAALDQHRAAVVDEQAARLVVVHRGLDVPDTRRRITRFEEDLGEDQPQGRRRVADDLVGRCQ